MNSILMRCYIAIVFGVLAAFVLLGAVLGKQLAVIWAVILVVGWGMTRMIRDAWDAVETIRELRKKGPDQK